MSTEAEPADAAAACQPLRHAHLLAQWAGDDRTTTAEGWPVPGDIPELTNTLGITAPETALPPELVRAWTTAHEIGIIEIDDGRVRAGHPLHAWADMPAEERLDGWASGLVTSLHAILDTVDSTEAAQLAYTALEVLTELETPATDDTVTEALEDQLQDEYTGLSDYLGAEVDLTSVVTGYCAALPGELRAFGAIDDDYVITPLGRWAQQELASWDQEDSEALGELNDMLSAAGIDTDDPDAIRTFFEQNPDDLASFLSDTEPEADNDDFRVLDLKAAFDLPDELPSISLPPQNELASAARANSPDIGELDDLDDDTAVAVWQNQLYDLLSNDTYLRTDADDETTHAGSEFDLDFTAVGAILVMRLFLDGPADQDEIREIVTESVTLHLDPTAAAEEWAGWVSEYGDPAQQLTESLLTAGAATQQAGEVDLTNLGRAAIRERLEACDVSVPLLAPAAGMPAGELVAAIETVTEPEALRMTADWRAGRDSATAADELLALAGDGTPTQRMIAMTVTHQLDPEPIAQWEAALDVMVLRPHAKMALAESGGDSLDEEDEVELDSHELAWLLADSLAATAGRISEAELAEHLGESVLPAADEPELFDTIRRSGHPEAHTVLNIIGTHHPDAKTAKAARRAASKAASSAR